MAKPKGATLTRLFAVSDEERKKFWAGLDAQKRKGSTEACTPTTGTPETGTPETGTPPTGIPAQLNADSRVAIPGVPVTGVPESAVPNVAHELVDGTRGEFVASVPVTGTPITGTPTAGSSTSLKRKIREAVKVQDGHSLGEQAVYAALWNLGHPHSEECRRVTIGYRTLSDACGLTVNNCKANLQALRRKLAIEEVHSATRIVGTTYLVYSYQAILRRRRQAGMTHVMKTKGVMFVNPETGVPVSGIPDGLAPVPIAGVPELKSGTPEPAISGIPGSGMHIRNSNLLEESGVEERSASAFPVVVATAQRYGVTLDDDAARRIVLRSKTFDETATDHEVAHFVEAKILQLRNSRNVENLVGLLIKAVPEFFSPPATELKTFRDQLHAKAQESRAAASSILDDPEASDNDRAWARALLGNDNSP